MIGDPIEFELFKNSIFSVADEMALTIFRTTYSGVLKDNMDYSTAMFDGSGKLVAQGLTLPGHLGSMPTAMAAIKDAFAGKIERDDVFILNDPFQGGMHLPDIFIFKPIFLDGELLAYAATVCHHTDVGGRVPGSNASDSTEIYQEGLRVPPLKLYDRGTRNDTLFALIERNVRVPIKVFGDLRAQLAACHISEQSLLELAAHYGVEKLNRYMTELIDYSERMTRAAIRDLPDGVYSFLDHIDDDGIDVGKPIPLKVTITKSDDQILVDWTGSSPQVKGAINNTLSFTKSASYCAIRSVLPANIPNNEGVFRAIWGGRPYADGLDGNSNIYANMASQSIEVTETEQPIEITAYEFIPDAMGPGKFRGGAPFRRDYRFLAEEGILQVRSDRRDFRPYGLYGGGPGKPSMNYLNPDRENTPLPSKLTMTIRHGDVFRHEVAGAGGWGDPLERDTAMVLRDVRNELVSIAAAGADYGVVLVEKPLAVDEAATRALRERLRRARNWPQTPAISWERPDTAIAAE